MYSCYMAIVQFSIGYSFKLYGYGGPRRRTRNEFKFLESYYLFSHLAHFKTSYIKFDWQNGETMHPSV